MLLDSIIDFCSVRYELDLTSDELDELAALRRAITDYPSAVHPAKMERFTELLMRRKRV